MIGADPNANQALFAAIEGGWKLAAGMMIVPAITGFALREYANTKPENRPAIFVNKFLAIAAALIGWWVFGFGQYADDHYLTGEGRLFRNGQSQYVDYFFNFMRCLVCVAIVGYSFAERVRMESAALCALTIATPIFSVLACESWHPEGILAKKDFVDYGGSGVIHYAAGLLALVGAAVLGKMNKSDDAAEEAPQEQLLMNLSVLLIWFGSYGLNAGAASIAGPSAGRAMVATTFAAVAGAAGSIAFNSGMEKKLNLNNWGTGLIGGLAAIAASAANIDVHNAILVGLIAGANVEATKLFLAKYNESEIQSKVNQKVGFKLLGKIVDPQNVYATHGSSGAWGVFAAGLFDLSKGFFYGKNFNDALGPAVVGLVFITLWTVLLGAFCFYGFEKCHLSLNEKLAERAAASYTNKTDKALTQPPSPAAQKKAEESDSESDNSSVASSKKSEKDLYAANNDHRV